MNNLQQRLLKAINLPENHEVNGILNRVKAAESCAEISKLDAIAFHNWVETLSPTEKVSVWSKDGQFKGLFNMDTEQLYEKYEQHKLKSQVNG